MNGNRLSRRTLLQATVGAMGLSLPDFLSLRRQASGSGRVRSPARSCIVLYCWGGISHFESFDPKPDAPSEIRGEFAPISTATPGIFLSEHVPQLSLQTDKLAIVRSVHHNSSAHGKGMYWNLTGHAPPNPTVAVNLPPSRDDWPSLGAMVAQFRPAQRGMPRSVRLPYPLVDNGSLQAGEFGGFLGVAADPIVLRTPRGREFGGVSRSLGSAVLNLSEDIDHQRLAARQTLMRSLEQSISTPDEFKGFEYSRQLAADMLTTPDVRRAYDLDLEDARTHERYGDHLCGQSMLLARRLTEAGVPMVTVCCAAGDLNGSVGDHWDTHADNFNRLKKTMLPVFDQAASALLDDLDERGLLSETLVVMLTDFGRTPKINGGAGRDHYPDVYSVFLAGGPIQGGQVYGSSDAMGAHPRTSPCGPADLHATLFESLGISPEATIHDALGRPLPVSAGQVLSLF